MKKSIIIVIILSVIAMTLVCAACQKENVPMTYSEILDIPQSGSAHNDRCVTGDFSKYYEWVKTHDNKSAFVEVECIENTTYIKWDSDLKKRSKGYTVSKLRIISIGEQFSDINLCVGDIIEAEQSCFYDFRDYDDLVDFYKSKGAVVTSDGIIECPDEYFELKLNSGVNYTFIDREDSVPLYPGQKYTGQISWLGDDDSFSFDYSGARFYPVDDDSPLLTKGYYDHIDKDVLNWSLGIKKIVEDKKNTVN